MDRRRVARPQRVLLVDDSADLRELWRIWLTSWGFAVEEASNGAQAVQQAQAQPPTLIVMDLAMPILDGRSAIHLLMLHPATAHIPILALSAQTCVVPGDLGAEPERFLLKPTDADDLLAHIRATLRQPAATPSVAQPG
jgi:DNA-binding response OmpR family regulator